MAKGVMVVCEDVLDSINALVTENPDFESKIRDRMRANIVRAKFDIVDNTARMHVGRGYKHSTGEDPRRAADAIVANIWKRSKALGGSITIQNNNKGGAETTSWNPPRKGTRGKRAIHPRTQQYNEYYSRSRGFVLHFLLSGTRDRVTGGRFLHRKKAEFYKYNDGSKIAYRGRIKKKDWFTTPATTAAELAAERFSKEIAEMIIKRFNKGK